MIQWKDRMLCEFCLQECETEQCPHCGNNGTIEHVPTGCLPPKTILKERYLIGKVLGRGGFGITYLAFDMLEECRVAIKEYFPDNLVFRQPGDIQVHSYTSAGQAESFRSGSEKFYAEAQTMARFNGHPNIVNVQRFFYENQTAYYVMEYLDGIDLKKYLDNHGKKLSFEDTMKLILPVMEAMTLVHSTSILHRDISPDNIFVLKDGTVKLLDFGSARQVLAEQSKSLSVILKVGFAPVEQYQSHGKQGPWTDIYALAATMYYCLTGEIPVAAMDRVEEDHLKKISELCPEIGRKADKVFAKALAVRAVNRYQSMAEFRDDLLALDVSKTTIPTMPKTATVSSSAKPFVWTKKRITAVVAAAAVLLCSSGIAYAAVKLKDNKSVNNNEVSVNSGGSGLVDDYTPTPEPTATLVPTPTPELIATPAPTPTLSPEPTATNTPTPTPSPTPTPKLLSTDKQLSFYKSVEKDTLMFLGIYNNKMYENAIIWSGELYDYSTGAMYDVAQEMIVLSDKYSRLHNDVLTSKSAGKYHFTLYYRTGSGAKQEAWIITVHDETVVPENSESPLEFYPDPAALSYGSIGDMSAFVGHTSTERVSYVKAKMSDTEETIPAKYCEILLGGKAVCIKAEYLKQKFAEGETITITYHFADGGKQTRKFNFTGAGPTSTPTPKPKPTATPTPKSTVTPSPTPTPKPTATPSPTPTPKPTVIPEVTLVPANSQYKYYQSAVEDTEVVLVLGKMVSWEGELYDYNTGKVYKIPQEMFELNGKYCRLNSAVFADKPASRYHLTVTFKRTADSEPESIAEIVQVYDKTIIPPVIDNSLCYYSDYSKYRSDRANNIEAYVHSDCTERVVSVSAKMSGMATETIPAEYCELLWGGKVVIINSRYLLQHFVEGETMTLTYYFESGHQMQKRITFTGGTATPSPTPTPSIDVMYHFYKSLADEMAVICYTSKDTASVEISYREYGTENWNVVSQNHIQVGERYAWIDSAAWKGLSPALYELKMAAWDSQGKSQGSGVEVLQIHGEEEAYVKKFSFAFDAAPFSPEESAGYTGVLNNGTYHIEKIEADIEGVGGREVVPKEYYELLYDRKVIIIKQEYLLKRFWSGKQINFYFTLDDGTSVARHIKFSESSAIPTPTPTPAISSNLLPMPTSVNQRYFSAYAEDTELVIAFSVQNRNPASWYGTCYNYVDGTTKFIPQNMIEIGNNYIHILDEFLLTLEPSTYKFQFYFGTGSDERQTERTVRIENEYASPIESGNCLAFKQCNFSEAYDVMNYIYSLYTCRFAGVAVDGKELDSTRYSIECDGKVLIVDKDYLNQFADNGTAHITYFIDNGEMFTMTLNFN